MNQESAKYIVFVDGNCNLCNNFVKFIDKRDKKNVFIFSSLQGIKYKNLQNLELVPKNSIQFLVLYNQVEESYLVKSEAVRQIFRFLSFYSFIAYLFPIVPLSLRDKIYEYIAKKRYFLFGKTEFCEYERNINPKKTIE